MEFTEEEIEEEPEIVEADERLGDALKTLAGLELSDEDYFVTQRDGPLETKVPYNYGNDLYRLRHLARTTLELDLAYVSTFDSDVIIDLAPRIHGILARVTAGTGSEQMKENLGDWVERCLVALARAQATSRQWIADLAEARLEVANTIQDLAERRTEFEKLRTHLESAAEKLGIEQHAAHFEDQANEHRKAARPWMWAAGIFFVVTFSSLVLWLVFLYACPPVSFEQRIPVLLAKAVLISTLISAAVFCARNYRVHRHNYIVNKHRQNALSSFLAFDVAAGDDQQTRNAVLLQATQCIYSAQPSGYTTGQEHDSARNTHILEIFKDLSGRS